MTSTYGFDDAVSGWLTQTSQVVEDLQQVPYPLLETILEALAEFQQHRRAEWAIRLPHILAYVIEHSDNAERVRLLHIHAILMSINSGIVSPIRRISSSKWRSELLAPLASWRENIARIAEFSEPWVAARVRALSASISRIIGPRSRDVPARASSSACGQASRGVER